MEVCVCVESVCVCQEEDDVSCNNNTMESLRVGSAHIQIKRAVHLATGHFSCCGLNWRESKDCWTLVTPCGWIPVWQQVRIELTIAATEHEYTYTQT